MNYVLNEAKMFTDITDGIAIIINSETGIYYGLNAFATNVYENIVSGASIEDIKEELKNINPDNNAILDNFEAFIKAMAEKEILILSSEDKNETAQIDKNLAKEDNFILELKEYNDAQELLLADPIHEVKDETGWTPEKDSIIKDGPLEKKERV